MVASGQIDWFASALMDIAAVAAHSASSKTPLYLHISIYVTCLCNPEAVPHIPNCDVSIIRPSPYRLLMELITPPRLDTGAATAPPSSSSPNAKPKSHLPNERQFIESDGPQSDIVFIDEESPVPVPVKLPWIRPGGGVAVCASGPESLIRETANAVSRVKMSKRGHVLGDVALHTELFSF